MGQLRADGRLGLGQLVILGQKQKQMLQAVLRFKKKTHKGGKEGGKRDES